MELTAKLQRIVQKLQQVQHKMTTLEAENSALRTENETLQAKLLVLSEAGKTTADHILHIATGEKDNAEVVGRALNEQDIRQQIDQYISEIDKCIEWLSDQ